MTEVDTPQTDMAELYIEIAPQLRRVLRMNLRVSDWVLDDACQMAWEALLAQPVPVHRSRVLGWLATTARREALALLRRSRAEACLDDAETAELSTRCSTEPGPDQAAEFWDRLSQLRRLSRRQQRIVWMQSLGFAYAEIAQETGESRRTVERQLIHARRRLQAA